MTAPKHLPRRYRLLESLGSGGEGAVWRARDRYREKEVALKFVGGLGGDAVVRLSREFLILSRLVHPNIARVLDYGFLGPVQGAGALPLSRAAYYTSDLASGGTLLEWTNADRGCRWEVFQSLVFEALVALAYLDRQGIHHGDVKPANLLLDAPTVGDGVPRLRLIDFGASRVRDTSGVGELGTPAYAPGAPLLTSPRAVDLYGLGMSLFHAAAGRLPFRLEAAEIAAWRDARQPARLDRVLDGAPATVCELVSRLTTYDEQERFRSSGDALAFFQTRVPAPTHSCRRRQPDPEAVSGAYESVLDEICRRIAGASGSLEVQCLAVPHERAAALLLSQLAARLQVHGVRCVTFLGLDDAAAQEQLIELTEEVSGAALPKAANEEAFVLELAARLEKASLAILLAEPVDGLGAGEPSKTPAPWDRSLLRSLLPYLCARDGRCRVSLVAATTRAAGVLDRLGLSEATLQVHSCRPLQSDAIRRVLREFFCVDEVPDYLVERVKGASAGLPHLVEESIVALADAGVGADCFGELQLPSDLPDQLVRPCADEPLEVSLPSELRGVLGFLVAAGEELSAEEADVAFCDLVDVELRPPRGVRVWADAFEALRKRALVRRDGEGDSARYSPLLQSGATTARELLSEDDALAVYEHLARSFAAHPRRTPRALEAATDHLLALGRVRKAARWALTAARLLRSRGRPWDALRMLRPLVAVRSRMDLRCSGVVGLRAADLLITCGRHEEALDVLTPEDGSTAPEWLVWHRAWLRARACEQSGDRSGALETLEGLVSGLGPSGDVAAQLELQARLVPLYFAGGYTTQAQEARERCRELLGGRSGTGGDGRNGRNGTELPADIGAAPLRAARAIGSAAAVEARYGDGDVARQLFERALALGCAAGRRELTQGILNDLAIFHAGRQEWNAALRVFRETQNMAEESVDRWAALKAIHNRAIAHYRLDDLSRAEELFREARTRSDALGRHSYSAAVWLGLAGVLREQGRLREALRLYRRVLRLGPSLCRPNDRAVAHNNLADLYLSTGRLAKALAEAETALSIATETQNRFLFVLSLRTRGKVYLALGDVAAAREDLEGSLRRATDSGDHRNLGAVHYYLGVLHLREGQSAEGWRDLRAAAHECRLAANHTYLRDAQLALASVLLAAGRRRFAERLSGRLRSEPGPRRGSIAAAVLRARTGAGWPARAGAELREIDRAVRRHGVLWEGFLALRDVARDGALTPRQSAEAAYLANAHGSSLLSHAPESYAGQMAEFWGLEPMPQTLADEISRSPGTSDVLSRGGDAPSASYGDLVGLLEAGADGVSLSTFLEACCRAMQFRSLAMLFDPLKESRPAELTGAFAPEGSAARLPVGPIEIARGRATPVVAAPFVLVRLGDQERARVLCAELEPRDGSTEEKTAAVARQLTRVATLVGVFLRIEELNAQLAAEASRHGEVRAELRKLHAQASKGVKRPKGSKELETAVLSQRLELLELRSKTSLLRDQADLRSPVGRSSAMSRLIMRLPALAASELPVLIVGESGVGKDLIARWLHYLSARRHRPYLSELCNLAESLAEAELFGFVAGAFTGAEADRPGIFQLADGGSLYLDEISSLSSTMQARLLRVLEEKRVRPVGAASTIAVDFRLLSSSRRSLEELEGEGGLRRDLLYRLNTEVVEIPPLRERREDIPLLAATLLESFAKERGLAPPYVHTDVYRRLAEHSWPGNVRELENELHRALARNPMEISVADVLGGSRSSEPEPDGAFPTLQEERRRVEAALVRRALEAHRGNATRAAKTLGITRRYLGTLLERFEIRLGDFKAPGCS